MSYFVVFALYQKKKLFKLLHKEHYLIYFVWTKSQHIWQRWNFLKVPVRREKKKNEEVYQPLKRKSFTIRKTGKKLLQNPEKYWNNQHAMINFMQILCQFNLNSFFSISKFVVMSAVRINLLAPLKSKKRYFHFCLWTFLPLQ